jgi:hypothetical protein
MIKDFVKQNWKRYAVSSFVTFLSTFFLVLSMELESANPETLDIAVLFGIIMVAVRAGFKAFIEIVPKIVALSR